METFDLGLNISFWDIQRAIAWREHKWLNSGVCPRCAALVVGLGLNVLTDCPHCAATVELEPNWEPIYDKEKRRTVWWTGPLFDEKYIVHIPNQDQSPP